MKKTVLFIVMIILVSCESNKIPDDFAIKISFGKQVYNSKSELFTREYLRTNDKSVKISLSNEQKIDLYKYYKEIEFLKFPSEFECDTLKRGGIIPSSDIELEITANGIVKSSRTSDYCTQKIDMEKEKLLYKFSEKIITIITNDSAYKKLPPTDYSRL